MVPRAWTPLRTLVALGVWGLILLGLSAQPGYAGTGGTCQTAYGATPTTIPDWLQPAQAGMDLSTSNRYDLLAGNLLASGIVDGSGCPGNGLNPDGSPNACGITAARETILNWQNRYDAAILRASLLGDIPPLVIKAVIAVESQFWPAADWTGGEIGLGQMTSLGADMVLMWNRAYARSICVQAFGEAGCPVDYVYLDAGTQALLRGLVLQTIDVTCPVCPGGIDADKGTVAVDVLAETLKASCSQSAQVISGATGRSPAAVMGYEDFWRFVLANYHSGAGCMLQALQNTDDPTSWNAIAANLSPGCTSGATYIRRIEEQIKP